MYCGMLRNISLMAFLEARAHYACRMVEVLLYQVLVYTNRERNRDVCCSQGLRVGFEDLRMVDTIICQFITAIRNCEEDGLTSDDDFRGKCGSIRSSPAYMYFLPERY